MYVSEGNPGAVEERAPLGVSVVENTHSDGNERCKKDDADHDNYETERPIA